MKKIFIILLIFPLLTLSSCSKNKYMNTGKITEIDIEKCSCCGGWLIEINGFKLRFKELPTNSNLNLTNANFPIDVLLNWKYVDDLACKKNIVVLDIVEK